MIIYRDFKSVAKQEHSILTIGTFDGVHLGHVEILKTLVSKAKSKNCRSVVITFNPHPRTVLYQDLKRIDLLTPFEKKVELIESFGIDVLVIIDFTQSFSQISYDYFLEKIIIEKIGLSEIILGYDHRFGKNRDGNSSILLSLKNKLGFEVTTLPPIQKNNITISSTKIREYLHEGRITNANDLLGRRFSLSGKVVHGDKRGRTLGFPTANIEFSDNSLLVPPTGVYFVEVEINKRFYKGVMNIGNRPSFANASDTEENATTINEVHILNFNELIYDKEIEISFIDRIRDEKKFYTIEELKEQIRKDIEFVQSF